MSVRDVPIHMPVFFHDKALQISREDCMLEAEKQLHV